MRRREVRIERLLRLPFLEDAEEAALGEVAGERIADAARFLAGQRKNKKVATTKIGIRIAVE